MNQLQNHKISSTHGIQCYLFDQFKSVILTIDLLKLEYMGDKLIESQHPLKGNNPTNEVRHPDGQELTDPQPEKFGRRRFLQYLGVGSSTLGLNLFPWINHKKPDRQQAEVKNLPQTETSVDKLFKDVERIFAEQFGEPILPSESIEDETGGTEVYHLKNGQEINRLNLQKNHELIKPAHINQIIRDKFFSNARPELNLPPQFEEYLRFCNLMLYGDFEGKAEDLDTLLGYVGEKFGKQWNLHTPSTNLTKISGEGLDGQLLRNFQADITQDYVTAFKVFTDPAWAILLQRDDIRTRIVNLFSQPKRDLSETDIQEKTYMQRGMYNFLTNYLVSQQQNRIQYISRELDERKRYQEISALNGNTNIQEVTATSYDLIRKRFNTEIEEGFYKMKPEALPKLRQIAVIVLPDDKTPAISDEERTNAEKSLPKYNFVNNAVPSIWGMRSLLMNFPNDNYKNYYDDRLAYIQEVSVNGIKFYLDPGEAHELNHIILGLPDYYFEKSKRYPNIHQYGFSGFSFGSGAMMSSGKSGLTEADLIYHIGIRHHVPTYTFRTQDQVSVMYYFHAQADKFGPSTLRFTHLNNEELETLDQTIIFPEDRQYQNPTIGSHEFKFDQVFGMSQLIELKDSKGKYILHFPERHLREILLSLQITNESSIVELLVDIKNENFLDWIQSSQNPEYRLDFQLVTVDQYPEKVEEIHGRTTDFHDQDTEFPSAILATVKIGALDRKVFEDLVKPEHLGKEYIIVISAIPENSIPKNQAVENNN